MVDDLASKWAARRIELAGDMSNQQRAALRGDVPIEADQRLAIHHRTCPALSLFPT